MGIPRLVRAVKNFVAPPFLVQDYRLDAVIREAFFEEAWAQPSPWAWDRLRKAVIERQSQAHGMWVLDELLRDPPMVPSMVLSSEQYRRAMRSYAASQDTHNRQIREAMWDTMLPTFSALVNW